MLAIDIMKLFGGGAGSSGGGGGGGGAGSVNLQDDSVVGTKYAIWTISADGFTYKQTGSGAAVKRAAWINPQLGMNLYAVRATNGGPDTPPGTFGSWLDLAVSRQWGWTNVVTPEQTSLTIDIRRKSDSVIVSTGVISLVVSGTL